MVLSHCNRPTFAGVHEQYIITDSISFNTSFPRPISKISIPSIFLSTGSDQFVEEGVLDGIHTKFALFTSFIVSIPHPLFVLFQPINKNLPLWNNKMTKLLLMLMMVNMLRCAGEMSDEF